jgi:hypothetical protein
MHNRQTGLTMSLIAACATCGMVTIPANAFAMAQQEATAAVQADTVPFKVVGVLVDPAGKPVREKTVSLLLVTSDTVAVPFPLFTPESKTDAQGRFALELPNSILQPNGVQLIGFAVGLEEWSEQLQKHIAKPLRAQASQKFTVIRMVPKSKTTDIGKIVLTP